MKFVTSPNEMRAASEAVRQNGRTIGFVPTMGYLHEGHLSLIRTARQRADTVVVSIFVNPVQFGPDEDLDTYPRDLERDMERAGQAGADIVFHPSARDMYPGGYCTYVTVEGLTRHLCGAVRKNHFRGVTTVCAKLFSIVGPRFAVFGQKDFQQSVVIKRMVEDLNLGIDIVTAPIVREDDGLAMSSRNKYLSAEERKEARLLSASLFAALELIEKGQRQAPAIISSMKRILSAGGSLTIEYISVVDPKSLEDIGQIETAALIALAVRVNGTRLIDNILIEVQP